MGIYQDFAYYYDELNSDVDYGQFLAYLTQIFQAYGQNPKLVLELACGTGSLTALLEQAGYDMIGVDRSEEMLSVARDKCRNVLLLEQDMTAFELYGTVDAVVCMLDSVNYVTDKRKLLHMFKLVNNYLNYDGLFVFDINSPYKLNHIIGNNTFVSETDEVFYVWENEKQKDRVHFYLTFFCKEGKRYRRFEEQHTERIYQVEELTSLLTQAGLQFLAVYGDFELKKPKQNAQRIFFVARKIKT